MVGYTPEGSEGSYGSGSEAGDFDMDASNQLGTNLDAATIEFLNEAAETRSLRIPPGKDQLTTNDYVEYLGIDLEMEPELGWIAREMCAAPMPPNAEMLMSKSNIVYFHDTENDYYVLEHPLTQRYLKIVERSRLDILALRTKPSVNGLVFKQPDVLFQNQFRNLQIPCQDCGILQSTLRCEQCVMSFCQACFDSLHRNCEGPRKNHTTIQTAVGSFCALNPNKKPQVYCGTDEEYYTFEAFERLHKKSGRDVKAMLVSVSDGEVVDPQMKCEECEDNPAAFFCDYCLDYFCVQCFWKCHFNGYRRNHTVTKAVVNPLCNQCYRTRASIFNEQTQELMCTECFTFMHYKGNRQLHLFRDAMNLLLLLEILDPAMQEHLRRARPRVLWAITQLQAWTRGIEARRHYRKRRDLVTKIQRRWRGAMTRRKLLGMLDHYKWRRKQINNYFLPKTRHERAVIKQKCQAMLASKDVTYKASKLTLRELRDTILDTAAANPLEDLSRTSQAMSQTHEDADSGLPSQAGMRGKGAAGAGRPQIALPVYTTHEQSRFQKGQEAQEAPKESQKEGVHKALVTEEGIKRSELTTKDIREARDLTLRQLLRIDDRVDTQQLNKYQATATPEEEVLAKEEAQLAEQRNAKLRHTQSYRDRKEAHF